MREIQWYSFKVDCARLPKPMKRGGGGGKR